MPFVKARLFNFFLNFFFILVLPIFFMALITLTSDFEKQSQGIGNMQGVIYGINPDAKVIHLMHGLPSFELVSAARTMETTAFLPIGIHVCVVDPGTGTNRKGIIVRVKRGDYLVGPDNGCLMTAPRMLGGIDKIVEITNDEYLLLPISPIFHGRHVFAPVAAYLSKGIPIEKFGPEIKPEECAGAPYGEARVSGDSFQATVIHVNKFGSIHLNILKEEWNKLGLKLGDVVEMNYLGQIIELPYVSSFSDVPKSMPLILDDDYNRIEVAINLGSFAERYHLRVGSKVTIKKI